MTVLHRIRRFLPILLLAVAGCSAGPSDSENGVVRETLENGALLISYPDFLPEEAVPVNEDLRVGVADGEAAYMFGDIRGFDAANDGTIFVFDFQASEIRAFDETGIFLRTVVSSGPGPGEIDTSNGFVIRGDSVLWVQDYGQWLMKGFGLDGSPLDSYQIPIRSRRYMWDGLVDNEGSLWKSVFVSNAPPDRRPAAGLSESNGEAYFVGFNPATERQDSVHLGTRQYRSFVVPLNNGFAFVGIPYDSRTEVVLDPAGGFWQAETDTYRIARLNETGDTTHVVHVDATPLPVTDEDGRDFSDTFLDGYEDKVDEAQEIISLMPEYKPIIVDLVVDDMGRLWVLRQDGVEEQPLFDVFDTEGEYLGSVRLTYPIAPFISIRVRNNRIYALAQDESGLPSVVRSAPVVFD
jgi:hypothetical protein